MKKILLIIALIFCIFQMVVLAVDIDIGSPAIDRDSSTPTKTIIEKTNPANATGTITSIEIYANAAMADVKVATFFVVSGNNLSTRDNETIGNVAQGYNQFNVNLDVVEGDYLGIFFSSGQLEVGDTGGVGWWYTGAGVDYIPCTNQLFSFWDIGYLLSLYGTGTAVVGWPHKWNTQTISKWNTKEFTKWNDLE